MSLLQNFTLEELLGQIEILQKNNDSLQNEVIHLKEQLVWFQRQIFGKKSEKIIKDLDECQLYFEGFEPISSVEEKKKITSHERKKPKRHGGDKITLPENLPVERQIIDLPEDKKICSETGLPLVKIGEEVSHKLAYKPGSYYLKEIVRIKYASPKGAEEKLFIPFLPESFIPKCRVDESFLAEILTKKFADHLPLYRIAEGLNRLGINISRQLLSQWVVRIGKELKPLYELMKQKILETEVVFMDETPIDVLVKGKGEAHQGYMWVMAGGKQKDPPYRVYHFKLNRKHENALELLGEKYGGILHSDKYGAYERLAASKRIIWCPCFSHIRRKFFEAETDPKFRKWILRKIRYLFMFERVAWARGAEERLRIRKEKEEPIIDELIHAVKNKLTEGKILPKSKFREALTYFYGLMPYLKNYTKEPWAHLDNGVAERAIRPLAIGRKNWLFVGSPNGGESAAVILSLVQTCRVLKINPMEYLEDLLRRFQSHSYSRLYELLPDNWIKNQS